MLKKFLNILGGAFILLFVAFYNGYPLFFSDSGTYIYSGFEKFVPYDRPITYGLFVFIFSLKKSFWFVVFIQNLITSYVLYESIRLLLGAKFSNFKFLFITNLLTLFTGVAWYSNQIMPDFFTPVFILLLFLILFHTKATKAQLFFWCALLILAGISHFSHLLIGLVLLAVFYVVQWLLINRKVIEAKKAELKRFLLALGTIVLCWFIVPTINYSVDGDYVISKGSHAFLVAHLADNGMLNKFLKENCDNPKYSHLKLCDYTNKVPTGLASFLWDENSVFENTGSWENSKEEYDIIINANLTRPDYLVTNIYKSSIYGLTQLTRFNIGDGMIDHLEGTAPYQQVYWQMNDELNNYLNSRQNRFNGKTLGFTLLNSIQKVLVTMSALFLLWLFFSPLKKQVNQKSILYLSFVVLGVIINAMILGGLNAPADRFQARVVWLLPFVVLVFVYINWAEIIKALKTK